MGLFFVVTDIHNITIKKKKLAEITLLSTLPRCYQAIRLVAITSADSVTSKCYLVLSTTWKKTIEYILFFGKWKSIV